MCSFSYITLLMSHVTCMNNTHEYFYKLPCNVLGAKHCYSLEALSYVRGELCSLPYNMTLEKDKKRRIKDRENTVVRTM